MSDAGEERQHARFKVGDYVRVVHGRETGQSGTIVMIHRLRRGAQQYIIELGNGQRAYCADGELLLEKAHGSANS
jgi:ribosomal protein S4E